MVDRTINFGSDSTEATYQIQDDDPAGGGDFVIRDTDANVGILSYDQTNDEWSLGASANFDTNNITNVATLDATTLNVDTLQGADVANAGLNEILKSDGNGNLQFTDIVTVSTVNVDTLQGADIVNATAGEALTSDGSGGMTFATVGGGIPANFTYVDENRSLDTVHTNNTGSALYVSVNVGTQSDTSFYTLEANVDGTTIKRGFYQLEGNTLYDQFAQFNIDFFVPDGSTYEVGTNQIDAMFDWYEAEL